MGKTKNILKIAPRRRMLVALVATYGRHGFRASYTEMAELLGYTEAHHAKESVRRLIESGLLQFRRKGKEKKLYLFPTSKVSVFLQEQLSIMDKINQSTNQ